MKIKSLAAETAIIRLEERRQRGDPDLCESLRRHRIEDVRREQRASMIAYAFIRGRPYRNVEPGARTRPRLGRVIELVHVFCRRQSWERPDKQKVATAVQQWIEHVDQGGLGPGVMTPEAEGSTPSACANTAG